MTPLTKNKNSTGFPPWISWFALDKEEIDMTNAIRNSSPDYHQKFDAFIDNINNKCSKECDKPFIKKQICKVITHLCEKYNNSIYSIHSHNKRVIARAYQSYKKNNNYIGNALKINANNFNEKCLNFQFIKSLKGEELNKFCVVLQKDEKLGKIFVAKNFDELLKPENEIIFNALPLYAKAAFIEQNKTDINFLSDFSNIYKNELAFDLDPMGSSNQELSEIQTAFKDAIIANKADIIRTPSLLASADKNVLQSTIELIMKEDESLGKALIKSFFTVNGAFVEKALTAEIKETNENALQANNKKESGLISYFNNRLEADGIGDIVGCQIFRDAERGYNFEFTSSTGKKIIIDDKNNKGKSNTFLSRGECLQSIKSQVTSNDFGEQDIKELCDFLAHCEAQGLIAGEISNGAVLHIEGDGHPTIKANYSKKSGVEVTVITRGQTTGTMCSITIGNSIAVINPKTEAEIMFTYPKPLGECKNRASNIEVKSFEQEIGDVTIW